jgi:hypothetical protein
VPDLLQLFGTSKKNGVLSIAGDQSGHIYLRQGRIVFAAIEGAEKLGPRKAFFRIIAWQTGRFVLEQASEQKHPDELTGPTEALLMEGLRQLDELRRIQPDLPPQTAAIELVRPLEARLRDLSPEQLDVLQTALEGGTVENLLDHSPLTDRDTAEAVLHLMKHQYLRLVS